MENTVLQTLPPMTAARAVACFGGNYALMPKTAHPQTDANPTATQTTDAVVVDIPGLRSWSPPA